VEINHPDPARNTPTGPESVPDVTPAKQPRPIAFGIRVKTRQNFYVAGRGLQSEWRIDNLELGGTSHHPTLTGSARMIRGYAMFLGRRFNIDEGRLELTGAIPPRPQINISASTRVSDIIARLEVHGSTDRPEIKLLSDPLLPEDEIMAMILFGKLTETMTPWQAIALANGLRVLSGSDSDVVSVLEQGQNLLSVDQIDIKQSDDGDGLTSIALGKHIGRSLYVEGEKGFGEAEDTVTFTYELSPRLVLETETSPRIREGINLYWRKDL
jgi:translocation and assembly module TamB